MTYECCFTCRYSVAWKGGELKCNLTGRNVRMVGICSKWKNYPEPDCYEQILQE